MMMIAPLCYNCAKEQRAIAVSYPILSVVQVAQCHCTLSQLLHPVGKLYCHTIDFGQEVPANN